MSGGNTHPTTVFKPEHLELGKTCDRVIIVGDVHGCVDELVAILAEADPGPNDAVVLAGDLVAKGPDSAGVLQLARERRCYGVVGNHDARWIRYHHDPQTTKMSAHAERESSRLSQADWNYLEALPWSFSIPFLDTLVVHAGLVPGVPLRDQTFDHLINMRSILPDGSIGNRATEGEPWGAHWNGPEYVVFGHDAIRGLQIHPFAVGLDTGCVYGKRLSALILPEDRIISVPAKRVYSEPRP